VSRSADALSRAGLLPPGVVAQARRWGIQVAELSELEAPPGPAQVLDALEEALQAPSRSELVTDPDLWRRYLDTAVPATLVLELDDRQKTSVELQAGQHLDGSWLVPWTGADPIDVLTNGRSHLVAQGSRYFFGDVREFHYGAQKAFLRCFVATTEPDDG
jgi:hypothetical protein